MNVARVFQRNIKIRRPNKRWRNCWRPKTIILSLIAIGTLFGLLVVLPPIALKLVGLDHPLIPIAGDGLQIYDRDNHAVCTIYGDRDQQLVKLKQVSAFVPKAFVAAEDHDFYVHNGVDVLAVMRAIAVDISAGHAIQGGSTISQQLIKNLYFEGKKRNIGDKFKEALMAMDIEQRYSKEQILEAYLNCVYFGRGVYGIERASQTYFGKPAAKLNLAESAFLAGLVTAPSELSQPANRKRAVLRQQLALNSMAELKFAPSVDIQNAKKYSLKFQSINPGQRYRHYTDAVIEFCRRELHTDDIYEKGYRVYTNMDRVAQGLAETAVEKGIKNAPQGINQGALVSISVHDGGIIAMVGGAGKRSEWNQALSPHTAGSAFKPFVYLAALCKGTISPDTMVVDEPLEIHQPGAPVYSPKNYDGQYLGPITIRNAIALSRNTCAVRVAQAVGPQEVVFCARQAGITSKLDENLSLALGSSAVSPLEMANAYATLARGGEFVEAQLVREIRDSQGRPFKQFQQQSKPAFASEPVAQLVDALQDVVENGTGTRARLFDRPVAGKTGTSDQGKDIWFVGFTPDMVTAVWGGNDQNKPVKGQVTGGSVMTKIWHTYMNGYYDQRHIAAGAFIQPLNPLIEDAEPVHIMPSSSGRYHNFFDGWFGDEDSPNNRESQGVRSYQWAPSQDVQEDNGNHNRHDEKKKSKKLKKFVRKIKAWLDF